MSLIERRGELEFGLRLVEVLAEKPANIHSGPRVCRTEGPSTIRTRRGVSEVRQNGVSIV